MFAAQRVKGLVASRAAFTHPINSSTPQHEPKRYLLCAVTLRVQAPTLFAIRADPPLDDYEPRRAPQSRLHPANTQPLDVCSAPLTTSAPISAAAATTTTPRTRVR